MKSGTYYENLEIDRSLALIGEDKKTTIIDGGKDRTVIQINRDLVSITGLTIRNGESSLPFVPMGGAGIRLSNADYCNISGNTISANDYGIDLKASHNNNIFNNNITDNWFAGVYLDLSSNNNLPFSLISLLYTSGCREETVCHDARAEE